MSNFMRKIEKNNKSKSSHMIEVTELYKLETEIDIPIIIEVGSYNKEYFIGSKELINGYGLFFQDFKVFLNHTGEKKRVIDFLQDSVENNYMLSDYLKDMEFSIKDDHIYFEENDFINMGEFYMDNYKVNLCGSYMFFEDLLSGKKFMYYGD